MILFLMMIAAIAHSAVEEGRDLFEQEWLREDQQVRVLFLPECGEKFSVAFDVRGGVCEHNYESENFIKPVLDFLKDESLRGCFLKNKDPLSRDARADFSVQDEDLANYERRAFYSEPLRHFLFFVCPKLCVAAQSRVFFHAGWQKLSADVLKGMLRSFKTWQWSIEERKGFEKEVHETTTNPRVFILMREGVVLKGVMKWSFFYFGASLSEKSLFDHKHNVLGGEMAERYPWSLRKRGQCLNVDSCASEVRKINARCKTLAQRHSKQELRRIAEVWLDVGHAVRVVLLPNSRERQSGLYAVNCAAPSGLKGNYSRQCSDYTLLDLLQDQFLLGLHLRPNCAHARLPRAKLGIKNVDLANYAERTFESYPLARFLDSFLPHLTPNPRGNQCLLGSWGALSYSLLRDIQPLYTSLQWSLVSRDDFEEEVMEGTQSDLQVFIIVEGAGIVRGERVACEHPPGHVIDKKSLLFYKYS